MLEVSSCTRLGLCTGQREPETLGRGEQLHQARALYRTERTRNIRGLGMNSARGEQLHQARALYRTERTRNIRGLGMNSARGEQLHQARALYRTERTRNIRGLGMKVLPALKSYEMFMSCQKSWRSHGILR